MLLKHIDGKRGLLTLKYAVRLTNIHNNMSTFYNTRKIQIVQNNELYLTFIHNLSQNEHHFLFLFYRARFWSQFSQQNLLR